MQALVAEVLKAWREAERVASEHEPGSPDHEAAALAVDRLRDLYAELTSAARARESDPARLRTILDTVR